MTNEPTMNTRDDAAVQFLGLPTLLRATKDATGGAFGLIEHGMMPPGFASPYHTHHREDEAFYVLEGEIAFVCGGKWRKAGPGAYVFGPREIPHGFKVAGSVPARMLLLCAPAGFENFVLEMSEPAGTPPTPPDMAKLVPLAARYQIDIHGPLPEEPENFGASDAPAGGLKSLNHRWIEAFNARDWKLETALRTPDFRAVMSGTPAPLDAAAWAGFMSTFTTAFPDSHISINSCITEGDLVATRWTLTGTHQGEFQGVPPTGRAVKFTGIEYNRVVDGRIAEHWSMFDNLALLQQLGVLPASGG